MIASPRRKMARLRTDRRLRRYRNQLAEGRRTSKREARIKGSRSSRSHSRNSRKTKRRRR